MKKLIVFDLDGTLAESKSAIDKEMADLLEKLLSFKKVALISGGDWSQFQKQVIAHLPQESNFSDLYVLPTCGTKFYEFDKDWKLVYEENFSEVEKTNILDALHKALKQADFSIDKTWGEQIEDRGSQITFSALGQQAPLSAKEKWDPDFKKRQKVKEVLDQLIPDFSINLGGTTSIDITKKGIDKAYGIHKLEKLLSVSIKEMMFLGDAIFPGGNDYPAQQAGVQSIKVRDPDDTKVAIKTIIAMS